MLKSKTLACLLLGLSLPLAGGCAPPKTGAGGSRKYEGNSASAAPRRIAPAALPNPGGNPSAAPENAARQAFFQPAPAQAEGQPSGVVRVDPLPQPLVVLGPAGGAIPFSSAEYANRPVTPVPSDPPPVRQPASLSEPATPALPE